MSQMNLPAARRRRRRPLIAASGPARNVMDVLLIVLGSFITALTFNMFLLPNRIASGGCVGFIYFGPGSVWSGTSLYAVGNEYSVIYSGGAAVRKEIRFAFPAGKYHVTFIRLSN